MNKFIKASLITALLSWMLMGLSGIARAQIIVLPFADDECDSQSRCLAEASQARLVDVEVGRNTFGTWLFDNLQGTSVPLESTQATAIANNPWRVWPYSPSITTSSASVRWLGGNFPIGGPVTALKPVTGYTILMVYQNAWDPASTSKGISLSMFGPDGGHLYSLGRSGRQWSFGKHIFGVDSTLPGSAYWIAPWDPLSQGNSDSWEWVYYTFLPGGKLRIDKFVPYTRGFLTAYDWQQTVIDAGHPFKGFKAGTPTANPPALDYFAAGSLVTGNGLDAQSHQPFSAPTVSVPGFNALAVFTRPLSINQMVAYQKNLVNSYYLTWGNQQPCNSGLWMNWTFTHTAVNTPCGDATGGNPPAGAFHADGSGGGVVLANVKTPVPPADLSVTTISSTSQQLTWSVPPNSNNQPDTSITQYEIIGAPTSIIISASSACSAGPCQYSVTGLTTNAQYNFTVRAINAWGPGAVSSLVRSQVPSPRQAYTWRNAVTGGGGGFIPGIVFNETEPNLAFVRTDIGGAYRLDPATNKWMPLMDWVSADDFNTMGVDSIATDAVNPNRLYLVAGTYTNSWTNRNAVLLRSTDKGNTFQRTNLPFKAGGNMPGRGVERLAIDPNSNNILFMGARSGKGLWKSTDYGASWMHVDGLTTTGSYVLSPDNEYSSDPIGVMWVKFDKRTGTTGNPTQTIYVGVADKGNSIFRSTNGGVTWSAVPGQPNGYLPHKAVLASTGMLYISYSDGAGPYDGNFGAVWKFNTATGGWTDISPQSGTGHYFGFGGLTVDKQNPNTVMVASLNSWWPDLRIWRSLNGGTTWSQIWDFTSYPNRLFRYTQDISAAPWLKLTEVVPAPPLVTPKLGWMVESMEIDPFNSDRMFYGTGATLYGTTSLTNWDRNVAVPISVFAAGIEETAVQSILAPPSGAPLFSLMYDVNGFKHDDLNATPLKSLPHMTTMDYAEYWPSWLVGAGDIDRDVSPTLVGVRYSENNGVTWKLAATNPAGATGKGSIATAPSPSRFVWSDPGAGVNVSTDKGATWVASSGIPKGALVVADRVNALKFYGYFSGTLYASVDGGLTFTARASGLPSKAKLIAITGRENHLWLASNGSDMAGLWRSTNGGVSFTQFTDVQKASSVGFGKAAAGQSYKAIFIGGRIGGVDGYFRSDDQGVNWVQVNDPQHQYATTGSCITGDPNIFGRVYVCTNGRGLIIGDIQ